MSFLLAVLSCFFVTPDEQYAGYIDYRTLSILLSLMITMAGFQKQNVFLQIGSYLVGRMNSIRGVVLILIGLCFVSSMFITNDVALLTFVPFSIVTLTISGRDDLYINVIVLETVAANLGSMLTPLGNPQNLYLYSLSGMNLSEFVKLMLPYSVAAAVLLLVFIFILIKSSPVALTEHSEIENSSKRKMMIALYVLMFFISILVVAHTVSYQIGLMTVVLAVLLFDRKILFKPDYSLLFTFVFLFIFIGNIKRIPALSDVLGRLVKSNEIGISILLSQFISNVPAAILCSGFTSDIQKLIVGTNLGGLGTLIASMASLISFKQYCNTQKCNTKKYIGIFTSVNIIFLIVMILVVKLFY